MSVLKKFKQSQGVSATTIMAVTGLAMATGLAIMVHEQKKQIEELERKVDHIINDMEK